MNIQRIQEKLVQWAVSIGGMALALFLVHLAAKGKMGIIAGTFGGAAIAALLFIMRERIWVLVPMAWSLSGRIPALQIPLTARDIFVIATFGMFLTLKAFKRITRATKWDFVSTCALLMLFYVGIAWIRNPTGFQALESARVGGRPYFDIFIGALACWMLRQCSLSEKSPNILAGTILASKLFEGVVAQIVAWLPVLIPIVSEYYDCPSFTWTKSNDDVLLPPGEEAYRRLGYLTALGVPLALYVVSSIRPLSMLTIRRWYYPVLYIFAIICVFLSGFRSVLMWVIVVTMLGSYFRKGWSDVLKFFLIGVLTLFILVSGQGTLFNLPQSAHRALSFLPGKWDQAAVEDAAGSTEWRVQMWKEMLGSNRYIENHMWGDGFGLRKRDLEIIDFNLAHGSAQDQQENFMITGGVHSGPVSTIRSLGYVGLLVLLVFTSAIAVRAYKIIRRAMGTPFQRLAFFLCLPSVVEPVFFVFVFGAPEESIPGGLFAMGILQMLKNSLDDYQKVDVLADPLSAPEASAPASRGELKNTPDLRPPRRRAPAATA